jgi:hypothetical protein
MKIWAKTKEFCEGKFLVVRRDGTVPHWPHFVLGARDPFAPIALRAYAEAARQSGTFDPEYADSILELAGDFERYRAAHGDGDPDAPPHRHDYPNVISAMRGVGALIAVRPDKRNTPKVTADRNA